MRTHKMIPFIPAVFSLLVTRCSLLVTRPTSLPPYLPTSLPPYLPTSLPPYLPTSLLFFLSFLVQAQFDAGPNDTINPGVPVTLTATYGVMGNGVTMTDDGVEGPFPIGFSFSFFGNAYNQFYIGSNGWISFSPNENARGTRQAFAVPSAAVYNPRNCILGPFQDINPIQAGGPYIFYETLGVDSNRRLVVMWCQAPLYECMDSLVTFQIVLNEGSNSIENHLMQKSACFDWQGNEATQGVQNENGYIGYAVPGRNATSWTAYYEGCSYMPTSADSFLISQIPYQLQPLVPGDKISYRWYTGGEPVSYDQQIVVTPTETTTYHAFATLCSGQEFHDSVMVVVIPKIPDAFTPDGDGLNDVFRIIGLPPEHITQFNFNIYNRWGQVVYSSTDIREGWDGSMNGEPCSEGVYVWVIWYVDDKKNEITNKGTVMIVK